jgi:PAS domain S-box-containing protein
MIIQDQSGRIMDLNPEVTRSYGWNREDLLGQPIDKIVPPQYREQQGELMQRCLAGYSVRHVESARQGKSGRTIPVLLTMSLLCDEEGKPFGVASIAKDLSEQKGLERQLRDAASDAALAEDKERRKLAVDLHDGLGQLLTVLGLKLGLLRDSTDQPQIASRVREIERVLTEVDERVSSLSFQLSPPILHDMGLVAAVEWLAEEFQNRFGVKVTVEDDGTRQVLDEATRVTLFRGLRELLLNVTKHARVGAAHVRLWREDKVVKLEVRDEGIGFDPNSYEGGYGLFSLRKRLNRLGGQMQIESAPDRGTRTVLTAPITSSIPETAQGEQ